MSPTIFRILMPDGSFSAGGVPKPWKTEKNVPTSKMGKIWNTIGTLKNHLRQYYKPSYYFKDTNEKMIHLYDDAVVVQYELVEVNRIPVKDWWKNNEENYVRRRKTN